ncbi:MAG TPA: CopG family transcriptional regulator [Egibacteraceae bacterium]|nr:CopG family transcriptional regulator [Egibacteraceae bacterium]
MKRTQIYISEEQERRIAAHAEDAGVSKAEIIRRLLDRGLGIEDGAEARLRAIDDTFGVLPDAPDWPEWLAAVRGAPADERLRRLGR